jgi:hypothetical protein
MRQTQPRAQGLTSRTRSLSRAIRDLERRADNLRRERASLAKREVALLDEEAFEAHISEPTRWGAAPNAQESERDGNKGARGTCVARRPGGVVGGLRRRSRPAPLSQLGDGQARC